MIDLLAALTPALVLPSSDSSVMLSSPFTTQPSTLPNAATDPEQEPIPSMDSQELNLISAALAKSIFGTSPIAQSLAQGGTKPRLQTEPTRPEEQPFEPKNVPLEPLQATKRPVSLFSLHQRMVNLGAVRLLG